MSLFPPANIHGNNTVFGPFGNNPTALDQAWRRTSVSRSHSDSAKGCQNRPGGWKYNAMGRRKRKHA
ncbi:hypothetical protein Hypma_013168 [Hypsizygus marmoreus]|uniref:Uncharacterized protein n=1 Tax=Hypsizygus marmoreus TaxID=39966 RepID=A0A369JH71_HYPMA|nr:hypothetical protein Hypma_013168 [Hypsizygus marmoreus]